MFDKLLSIGYYLLIALVLVLGVLLVGIESELIEGYELRIVQSGSMEPAIATGALILTRTQEQYAVGDVITYTERGPQNLPTTHRIIADGVRDGEVEYTTQGDANDAPDPNSVPQSAVSGKVVLDVPWLGYLIDFARQPLGFVLLIVIPALAIFIDESINIYKGLRERKAARTAPPNDYE